MSRFGSARKLASWAALTPTVRGSDRVAHYGHISKEGSVWLRWVLCEAAQTAKRSPQFAASYQAIAKIIDLPVRLAEYSVRSVTAGIDALGEVSVRIESGGRTFHGRGADPDIIVASTKAYVNALNKAMAAPREAPERVKTGAGV